VPGRRYRIGVDPDTTRSGAHTEEKASDILHAQAYRNTFKGFFKERIAAGSIAIFPNKVGVLAAGAAMLRGCQAAGGAGRRAAGGAAVMRGCRAAGAQAVLRGCREVVAQVHKRAPACIAGSTGPGSGCELQSGGRPG